MIGLSISPLGGKYLSTHLAITFFLFLVRAGPCGGGLDCEVLAFPSHTFYSLLCPTAQLPPTSFWRARER
jgi:hypothetical protein